MSPFDANSPRMRGQTVPRNPSRLREVMYHDQAKALVSADDASKISILDDGIAVARDEYAAYADALAHSSEDDDVLGEMGLLAKLYSVSALILSQLEESGQASDQMLMDAHLECRTWDLVQRLYMERTKDADIAPRISKHVSNHTLVQHLYDTDNIAAETKIVLDWLHDGDVEDFPLDLRGNRWFYTKEGIKSSRRGNLPGQESKLVDALDPDAPTRQGKKLAEEDQEYDRNLVRAMFGCVRAGKFSQAADLARQSGEYWRAASLQGCVEHFDPQLDGLIGESEGTKQKPLWRRMCFALSQQSSFDQFERALYGALCGDIASVLPITSSWEDRLWVHYNAMHQSILEAHLKHCKRVVLDQEFAMSDYSHLTAQSILDGLLQSSESTIRDEARSPMRIVQARLLTNQINLLIEDVHRQLQMVQKGGSPNVSSNPAFLKFVVHLIIVLRRLRANLPEESSNTIIQAYVEILTISNQADAVALYASQLPPSETVESLARFFMFVENDAERKMQLERAQRYGVDTKVTILRTIELVFERVLSNFGLGEGIRNIDVKLEDEEESCIRALEWLNVDDSFQLEAVILGNNLFRKLLLAGRTGAARALATRMPDTSLVPVGLILDDETERHSELVDAQMRNAIEYVGYCTLVKAFVKYEEWKALIRQRPQEINGRKDPVGLRQWKNDIDRLRAECLVVMREILSGNWCDAVELGHEEQGVIDEMYNLRTMYVPEVVLKMHGVLSAHEGRDVAAVMELAVQVSEHLTMPMKQSGMLPTYVSELALLGAYLA